MDHCVLSEARPGLAVAERRETEDRAWLSLPMMEPVYDVTSSVILLFRTFAHKLEPCILRDTFTIDIPINGELFLS